MGLAASQARFLAITSRKANCELESMNLAQKKLSITRELAEASSQYQGALNKTKLVWDPDGSGSTPYDLSYDILMRPSNLNNYTPYLLNDRLGRVVLDPKMAKAAKLAGIPEDGTTARTSDMFIKFVNAMVSTGGMSDSAANAAKLIGLQNKAGLGAPLLDKTQAAAMNIDNLIGYIDLTIDKAKSTGSVNVKELAEALKLNFGQTNATPPILDISDGTLSENTSYFLVNGVRKKSTDVTLSDLLSKDITYAHTSEKNHLSFWKKVATAVAGIASLGATGFSKGWLASKLATTGGFENMTADQKAIVDFVDQMGTAFGKLLKIDDKDPVSLQAFAYAIEQTIGLLAYPEKNLGSRNHSDDAFNDAIDKANDYNGWVTKSASKNKNFGTTAISLSNMAESFLTFFAQAQEGYDGNYYIRNDVNKSSYVTDDPYYMFEVNNPDANTSLEMYNAEFYSVLFNNICANGWTENENLDDNEYLSNALKNGQLFVASLSADNYYYQDRYVMAANQYDFEKSGFIIEVKDEDAITQAEREYTVKKSKLDYKEEQIEVDMKNLDVEIASLTSEYDTVKNLISKNVEKTFSIFNNS